MRGWVVGLLLAVLLVVLGAGALIAFVVGGSGTTAIVDLDVGDCFDLPPAEVAVERFETVELIDCEDPHDVEVVLVGELNPDGDADYPDDDELFALADRRCATVEGIPADEFGLVPIAPTRDTWDGAEGRFTCLALAVGGAQVTGSLVAGDAVVRE